MKAFFIIFIFFTNTTHADVHKCMGDDGVLKFSDSPCNAVDKKASSSHIKNENNKDKKYPGYN
ncbi:MAG: hypothetical protein B0W54_12595 [Cellvibrio sp. 79]|nr:MAG: hypothetical protein B0W54_12595 [Cellvibrio sp. 79]